MNNEELVKLYQNGDKKALEELIDNNVGAVKAIANRYNNINPIVEFEDIMQAGYIGIIEAADKYKFDIDKPTNFITLAYLLIKQRILDCVNGRSSGNQKNNEFYKSCSSLNDTLKCDNDVESEIMDIVDSHDTGIENIEDKIFLRQLRSELEGAMKENNTLREREILKLYYGWNIEPVILNEIGEMFNIESSKVRQIYNKALRKLRGSKWCRTEGIKFKNEIMSPFEYNYRTVEERFDYNLRHGN